MICKFQTVKHRSAFVFYQFAGFAHDDDTAPRSVMDAGTLTSRATFARDMAAYDRSLPRNRTVDGFAFVVSADRSEVDPDDVGQVTTFLDATKNALDEAMPSAPKLFAVQVDGKSGLAHIHVFVKNQMLASGQQEIIRRTKVGSETKETISWEANQAVPSQMRNIFRVRHTLDKVMSEQMGLDNKKLMAERKKTPQNRWKDQLRKDLDDLTALPATTSMDALRSGLENRGYEVLERGKKEVRWSIVQHDATTGARHEAKLTTNEKQLGADYTMAAVMAKVEANATKVKAPRSYDEVLSEHRRASAEVLATAKARPTAPSIDSLLADLGLPPRDNAGAATPEASSLPSMTPPTTPAPTPEPMTPPKVGAKPATSPPTSPTSLPAETGQSSSPYGGDAAAAALRKQQQMAAIRREREEEEAKRVEDAHAFMQELIAIRQPGIPTTVFERDRRKKAFELFDEWMAKPKGERNKKNLVAFHVRHGEEFHRRFPTPKPAKSPKSSPVARSEPKVQKDREFSDDW